MADRIAHLRKHACVRRLPFAAHNAYDSTLSLVSPKLAAAIAHERRLLFG
jgi:hypothetical protein